MGTEVQSKMHLPGYYSLRDPNANPGSNGWPLKYDSKTSESGKSYDVFTSRVQRDGVSGYDKEQLRETILKHESIFRHQLNELHRLYRIQRNLMNDMKNNELHKCSVSAGTSRTTLVSSHIPSQEDRKKFHFVVDSDHSNPSTSRNDGIQMHSSLRSDITMQSKFGLPQYGVGSSDNPSLELKCKKTQRQLFDLELPADEYINSEHKLQSVVESFHTSRSYENSEAKYVNLATDGSNSALNGDALGFNYNGRKIQGLTNLNETSDVKEAFGSASGDSLDHSPLREAGKQDLSACLYSDFRAKEFSQNLPKERNEWLTSRERLFYNKDDGNNGSNGISLSGSSYPQDSSKSLRSETRIAKEPAVSLQSDEIKQQKRKLFGVEIPERNHSESATPSHTLGFHPFAPQIKLGSKPLSISLSENLSSSLNQRNNYLTFMPYPGAIDGQFCANGNLRSTSVPRAEDHNHFNKGLQLECKQTSLPVRIGESRLVSDVAEYNARNCSGGLGLSLDEKYTNYENSGTVHLRRDRNEETSQENIVSFGGQREPMRPQKGLSWLHTSSHRDISSSMEREGFDRMKLNHLQNGDRDEMMINRPFQSLAATNTSTPETKTQVGDVSTDRKILGFSISKKAHVPQDLPSSSSLTEPDSVSLQNKSVNCDANSKHQIDLNLCAVEEEAASAFYSPKTVLQTSADKVEIDLEAPVVLENEMLTEDSKNTETKPEDQPKSVQDELGDSGISKSAAEALVAISSACLPHQDDNFCQRLEASQDSPLCWFAEIVTSSYKDEPQEEAGPVLKDKNDACHEDSVPGGLDYFEYMTLKLAETKVDECYLGPEPLEDLENEKPVARRPRRGQARRGRQRKDFQRDILPGLTSLSKYEVTEDLQTFEGIIRATGGAWQSRIVQRNGKSSSGRGRRCSRNSTPSPSKPAGISSPVQQLSCNELVLREGSLTGWGKRTRRLPRQRCTPGSSSDLLK